MFEKILIANRGEIALRILRAAKELGIATVAVHSTVDTEAMHVKLADESVCIGPPPARDSYLNIPALLAACEITGADAIHPGYGFCRKTPSSPKSSPITASASSAPSAEHIRIMGDKIEAKRTASPWAFPACPAPKAAITDDDEAMRVAGEIGFPVLVKAAAGGGGRGMKVARTAPTCRTRSPGAHGSQGGLRRRRRLSRKISRKAPPYRNPDSRRRPGQRRACRRARLLLAAPPPKGAGGNPLARPQPGPAPENRRNLRQRHAQAEIFRRAARWSSSTRTASSTSSR